MITYVRTSKGVCNSIYVCMVVRLGERGKDVHLTAPLLMGYLWARASLFTAMLSNIRAVLVLWLRVWPVCDVRRAQGGHAMDRGVGWVRDPLAFHPQEKRVFCV